MPELVRQIRAAVGEPHSAAVHFGATSQDVVDTALVLRLKPVVAMLDGRLAGLVEQLLEPGAAFRRQCADRHDAHAAGDPDPRFGPDRRLARSRWNGIGERLAEQAPRLLVVQFGGAAGTLDKLGDNGPAVRSRAGGRARPRRRAAMAQPARYSCGFRRLAVAGDRQPGKIRPGRRADGAGRRRDRACGRRRIIGHAAQAKPGEGRSAGGAGALQRHAAIRHASGAGARAGTLGRGLDARMAAFAADGHGDRRRAAARRWNCRRQIEHLGT